MSGKPKQIVATPRASGSPSDRRAARWWLAGVLAITALAYLRCLGNGFVFDDHEMILVNRYIGDWSFLGRALVNDSWWFRDPAHLPQSHYYRPLQDIWLGLNYHLFGLDPVGWHALMVALHLGAVLLAFRIASLLSGSYRCGVIAALLFGLMPIHAEPVVWATAIPESLAGTLELAAFYGLMRYHQGGGRRALYWSLAGLAGALLSHESAASFALLAAVYVWFFSAPADESSTTLGRSRQFWPRAGAVLGETVWYFVLTLAYLGLRLAVLGFIARRDVNNQASLAQLILTLPSVLAKIGALLVMPWQAGPSHRVEWVTSAASPVFVLPLFGLGLLAAAGCLATGGGLAGKRYRFCAAWIVIALLPTLNLAALYPNALITDRYLYFASYGWCLLVALLAESAIEHRPAWARPIAAAVGAVAVVYGLSLWHVQRFWHDELALFGRCIEVFPAQEFCHNRLGMALLQVGRLNGAEQELRLALQLDPKDYAAQYDLGLVLARQDRFGEASREMAAALEHLAHPPASAYVELADLYNAAGQDGEREAVLNKAAQLPGGDAQVELARARWQLARGDGSGAQRYLEPLLARDPNHPDLLLAMGSAMDEQGRYDEALGYYRRALAQQPDSPRLRMLVAQTLAKLGRN